METLRAEVIVQADDPVLTNGGLTEELFMVSGVMKVTESEGDPGRPTTPMNSKVLKL